MKDAPRMDSFVETPDGAGTIISVNTLREKVRVRLDDAPDTLKTYHNSEIRVVRSGKGKRPEGYVQPPKEELAKLRKVTESPEDQMCIRDSLRPRQKAGDRLPFAVLLLLLLAENHHLQLRGEEIIEGLLDIPYIPGGHDFPLKVRGHV